MLQHKTPFYALFALLLLGLAVNVILHIHTQDIQYPDSLRYLAQAEKIKHAELSTSDNLWSIGYSGFIFLAYSIYDNPTFVDML
ncbi:MAG: hypothetical protein AAF519_19910 [Bacteroidota bacterium]